MITSTLYFLSCLIILNNVFPDKPDKDEMHWYRGNTHAHARFSDENQKNDVPEIAGWYRQAGYDFLMIAEHNYLLSKSRVICHEEASDPPGFLMLCGLELSENRHLTALGINAFIDGENSLQNGVDKTLAAGGLPILNHPQKPVVSAITLLKTKGLNHFEVFNGNNPQDTPANEQLWDSVLSAPGGRIIYAVASDDNHYKKSDVAKGWIMVRSKALTKDLIKENIRKGNFYATTGILLKSYKVNKETVSVNSTNGKMIVFIGKNGKVLKAVKNDKASYKFNGDEGYVRVKISDYKGRFAWTQPVVVK